MPKQSVIIVGIVVLIGIVLAITLPLTLNKDDDDGSNTTSVAVKGTGSESDVAIAVNDPTGSPVAAASVGIVTTTTDVPTGTPVDITSSAPSSSSSAVPSVVVSSVPTNPVVWQQLGDEFSGGLSHREFIPAVEVSNGGELVWVTGDGVLQLFQQQMSSWTLAQDLSDNFPTLVKEVRASSDGKTVVAGEPMVGKVLVLASSGDPTDADSSWSLKGNPIVPTGGAGEKDAFGYSVDISDDGNAVAIGAMMGAYAQLSVFRGNDWTLSYKFQDDSSSDENSLFGSLFGCAVALSGDGSHMLVGDKAHKNTIGATFAYAISDTMAVRKQVMQGNRPQDGFGAAVALSRDGSVAAVGTDKTVGGNQSGGADGGDYVRAYRRSYDEDDGGDYYALVGNDVKRDRVKWFGGSVSLSGDGTRLVVGAVSAPSSIGFTMGIDEGKAFVYSLGADGWKEMEEFTVTLPEVLGSSTSVAMSEDGKRIAVSSTGMVVVHESSPGV